MKRPDYIIKNVLFSEKSVNLATTQKVYTLSVDLKASKDDIKKAVKHVFNVDVMSVNTSILRGDVTRRQRSKTSKSPVTVKKSNIKKAFIKLKAGQEIPYASLQGVASTADSVVSTVNS
jgi:large subunit ribosomal protein L23